MLLFRIKVNFVVIFLLIRMDIRLALILLFTVSMTMAMNLRKALYKYDLDDEVRKEDVILHDKDHVGWRESEFAIIF